MTKFDLEKKKNDFFKGHPWWNNTRLIVSTIVAIIATILIIIEIINLLPSNYKLTNTELKEQTLEIKTEIIIYADEREKNQPQIDFNNWKNSTDAYLNYNKETENQWDLRFASKVQFLYGEFQKRNMKIDEITEMLIKNPGGSTSWIKIIAIELGTLAYQL